MKLIDALKNRDRGAVIKHDHFFSVYDSHLYQYKDKSDLKILEIGVYNGGSLYMWKKYFPQSKIVGIDIDPYTTRWRSDNHNIRVYIGDQCDIKFLQKVVDNEGPFDLIIDDGGHENSQIITSLDFLFDHLKPGGTYVVEDTFASYYPEYSCDRSDYDPILKPFDPKKTSMEFLKNIADKLNCWAYRDDEAKQMKKTGKLDKYETDAFSVHFYDSIVFIQKFPRSNSKSFGEDKWYDHPDKMKEFALIELNGGYYNFYGFVKSIDNGVSVVEEKYSRLLNKMHEENNTNIQLMKGAKLLKFKDEKDI